MVRIRVDNRIRVHMAGVPETVLETIRDAFRHKNPEHGRRLALGKWVGNIPQFFDMAEEDGEWLTLPRGGMQRVREALRTANLPFRVKDAREAGQGPGNVPPTGITLRPYQEESARALLQRENALLRAPTASGKTSIALAIAGILQRPTLVVVNEAALYKQWLERAVKELGYTHREVGQIRGKKRYLRPLTIAMQKTLAVHGVDQELAAYFGVVICDEVQLFAAKTFFAAIDPFPARYRFGISADESRKDQRQFLIYDLFGDVAANISQKELEADGHVLEVEARVVETKFEAPWFLKIKEESGGQVDGQVYNRLIDEMSLDDERNRFIVSLVASEVKEGRPTFVMAHRREHCATLSAMLSQQGVRCGLLLGGKPSAEEFQRTIDRLKAGDYGAGIGTYKAIAQGLDAPNVSSVVCATPIASNRQQVNQVRGRVARAPAGKVDARFIYPVDRKIFPSHVDMIKRLFKRVLVPSKGGWLVIKDKGKGRTKASPVNRQGRLFDTA